MRTNLLLPLVCDNKTGSEGFGSMLHKYNAGLWQAAAMKLTGEFLTQLEAYVLLRLTIQPAMVVCFCGIVAV